MTRVLHVLDHSLPLHSGYTFRTRAIMTAQVVTVGPDTPVTACMQLMTERRIRHLPVVEGGQVVGVISIGDLVKAVIADQQLELEQLQRYIAG